MIQRIFLAEELCMLPAKGIEAQKIRALFAAYGGSYDFCRFYRQGNSFISSLDGSYVLCADDCADFTELVDFFRMCGYSDIFCSEAAGETLSAALNTTLQKINLMHYRGGEISCELNASPELRDVYSIISEGFEIGFEPWYLDMSHRVRHGVTRCCTLCDNAALVIQHNLNGEALISQVACRKAARGQGIASRLVISAAASLAPSDVYVLCEDGLMEFYIRCGFAPVGKNSIISQG